MNLQFRMWLLVAALFAILYGVTTGLGTWFGVGDVYSYLIFALVLTGFQYLIGPSLVSMMMKIKWVSEIEEPELHRIIGELAQKARVPKPKVGISQISIPNAFAFGKSLGDGRVCITQGLKNLLTNDELKGVVGHEISHLKNRDMMIMTLLSVIPLILYYIARNLIWGGRNDRKNNQGYAILIGLGAILLYFLSNLLVLYGSRIREYYADEGSVKLGNPSHYLASALYKLTYSSAKIRQDIKTKEELHRVEGLKAFFLNDISLAGKEVEELKEIDKDFSGTIDQSELLALRYQEVKPSVAQSLLEIFTTHPNMLRRIKYLATLS